MAGFKVIAGSERSGSAPIRAVITAQGPALALLESAEGKTGSNDVIRVALQAGGDLWINVFLPMRFTEYAKRLGYSVKPGWIIHKQRVTGQALPFVYLGGMRAKATGEAYAIATAKKGGGQITIKIPTDHALQAKDSAVLRRIPEWEISRIADEVQRVLIASLNLRGLQLQTRAPVSTAQVSRQSHQPTRKSA